MRCDLVRYGNLLFESAGGHTNLEGAYSALGASTLFRGSSQHGRSCAPSMCARR
jgi:hypothetical protein